MSEPAVRPSILLVDDEQDFLKVAAKFLTTNGYDVVCAESAAKGLALLRSAPPALILLDIMMPQINGYEFCRQVRAEPASALIPVIFLTALDAPRDKAKAFAVGATDYLAKPLMGERLLEILRWHLDTKARWETAQKITPPSDSAQAPVGFAGFQEFLCEKLKLSPDHTAQLRRVQSPNLDAAGRVLNLPSDTLARFVAEYCRLPYCPQVDPEAIQLALLPAPFCQENLVVPTRDQAGRLVFLIANPFDPELLMLLQARVGHEPFTLAIADRKTITFLFAPGAPPHDAAANGWSPVPSAEAEGDVGRTGSPVPRIADDLLQTAIAHRASDIHIEPKDTHLSVRIRVDGDMRELYTFNLDVGAHLISRFKVLGGMDIAEKRKPQDGVMEAAIDRRTYKFRLATTSTPHGESLIIRVLDPNLKPKRLEELGMSAEQVRATLQLAGQSRGLVLIVGPTGSGKTTTVYSLLAQIDCQTRSLVSVEDPVEYRIPFANQQQVNEKAGITFEAVLKSAVRQDPDILFVGEVRDAYSAKTSVDFASTGHLTITTLHTSNTTTAIFRLERLGLNRGAIADTLLGIVAQRLLKTLCPDCRTLAPPSEEELAMLAPFTAQPPAQVAHPVGCARCHQTGYRGRDGVFEILACDAEITGMIRANRPIADIRQRIRQRGGRLISHHAVEKVLQLRCAPKDVYEQILVEELLAEPDRPPEKPPSQAAAVPSAESPARMPGSPPSILVVDDDADTRALIARLLGNRGYAVTVVEDGVSALLDLGKRTFDLIISDVNMPNLDGFKLLEVITQKGLTIPVLLLTGLSGEEDETKGLALGAVDYLKKPFKKEVLELRVKRALERAPAPLPQQAAG